MVRLAKFLLIGWFAFVCVCAHAMPDKTKQVDFKKPTDPWRGSQVQLGLNLNTGNTDAADLNGELNLDYAKNHWENALDLTAEYAKAQSVLNKKKYTANNQVKYGFDKTRRHFLFLRGGLSEDHFSPYSYQSIAAFGYGRDLINRPGILLSVQAGPGYRNDKVRGSGDVEERFIGTLQVNAKVQFNKNCFFTEVLQYDSGPPFNYLDSKSSFSSFFMRHWALKLAFNAEYYSRIPPRSSHTEKLDTTTTVALVYNF